MKLQNLTEEEKQDDDESDDESDDDDPPELDIIPIPHAGAVNRIRVRRDRKLGSVGVCVHTFGFKILVKSKKLCQLSM